MGMAEKISPRPQRQSRPEDHAERQAEQEALPRYKGKRTVARQEEQHGQQQAALSQEGDTRFKVWR